MKFKNRKQAGALLAQKLKAYEGNPQVIVLGLPRGGVVPAYEVAKELNLPLDTIAPRKIGTPLQPELAVGAVTEDGTVLFNDTIMRMHGLSADDVLDTIQNEQQEAKRRTALFRKGRPPLDLNNKIVILIDDGAATGATMRAAVKSVQKKGAQKIIVALPVAPKDFRSMVQEDVDETIIIYEPDYFPAVGYFFQEFDQVPDEVVCRMLKSCN